MGHKALLTLVVLFSVIAFAQSDGFRPDMQQVVAELRRQGIDPDQVSYQKRHRREDFQRDYGSGTNYHYHPGDAFMRKQRSLDPTTAELLEGVFERAREWHSNGGSLSSATRERREAILNNYVGSRKRQATAPPFQYSLNPDPNPFIIPAGAPTIKVGRTWPQSLGNPETPYGLINEQGFRTFERIFNTNGGMMFNGTPTYLQYVTYNDGGDCNLMIILYEYLITEDGSVILHTPLHYACSLVALIAEAYAIPLINTCDYTMPLLLDSDPAYIGLKWTWDFTSSYFTAGDSIIRPLWLRGAKSVVTFEVPENPLSADRVQATALSYNMTVPLNKTVFSLADAAASYNILTNPTNCSYWDPFVDLVIAADPDILYGSVLTETEQLLTCFYRRKYRPRGLSISIGYPVVGSPTFWKSVGILADNLWVDNSTFSDPWIPYPSVQTFVKTYDEIWQSSETSLGYQATPATGTGIGMLAIMNAGSLLPADIGIALDNINVETIVGPIALLNGTRHYLRPYYDQQTIDINNTQIYVFPEDYVDVKPAVYPFPPNGTAFFPKEFLDSLLPPKTGLSRRNLVIIIVLCVGIGVPVLVIAFIAILAKIKYHFVLIDKGGAGKSSTWDGESQRDDDGVLGRVMPCFRTE